MTKPITTIEDVRPQTANANLHTPRGMGELERSIQQDGWIGAITVAADGETFDGSARVEVAGASGFEEPIIIRSDGSRPIIHIREDIATADDPRAKRLGIASNRVAELNLSWSPDVLDGLIAEGLDISSLFREGELPIAAEKAEPGAGGDDFDTTPEEGETRCQSGDLWVIGGRHRLLVGDCTDPAVAARLMGGEEADLGIHDPPYGIKASGMTMGSGESAKPKSTRLSHNQEWDRARPDIGHLFEASRHVCIWGGNYFADVLPVTNDWLCWWKKNDDRSFSEFELAWTNYGNNSRHLAHHWGGEEKEHITQKPLPVIEWAIEQCPGTPHVIIDLYAGSGTTMIAAHRMGRSAYLMEIAPKYADVILRRAEAEGLPCERIES